MKIRDLLTKLDQIAPFSSAEEWDNVGLLVGDEEREVETVLLATDCTKRTLEFAKEQGAEVILTHHPLIFHAIKKLTSESFPFQLASAGIAVIGYHTNWDKAEGGVDDTLARLIQMEEATVLDDEGFGRIGVFTQPTTAQELALSLKNQLKDAPVRLYGPAEKTIKRPASLCGCGESGLQTALNADADCIITGEMRFAYLMDALRQDVPVILLGHGESERPAMATLQVTLAATFPNTIFLMDDKEYDLTVL